MSLGLTADKAKDVRGQNLGHRLVHGVEENLEIVSIVQPGVGATATAEKIQILIDQILKDHSLEHCDSQKRKN